MKDKLKMIALYLTAVSLAIFEMYPMIVWLIILLILFLLFYFLGEIFKSFEENYRAFMYIGLVSIRFILLIIICEILTHNIVNNNLVFLFLFVCVPVFYFPYGVLRIILGIFPFSVDWNYKFTLLYLVFSALSALVVSDLIFSYGYRQLLEGFYNEDIGVLEAFHLSFLISNTLPVDYEDSKRYIELLTTEPFLYVYKMLHIYFKKIMELTVLAVITGYLIDLVKDNVTTIAKNRK